MSIKSTSRILNKLSIGNKANEYSIVVDSAGANNELQFLNTAGTLVLKINELGDTEIINNMVISGESSFGNNIKLDDPTGVGTNSLQFQDNGTTLWALHHDNVDDDFSLIYNGADERCKWDNTGLFTVNNGLDVNGNNITGINQVVYDSHADYDTQLNIKPNTDLQTIVGPTTYTNQNGGNRYLLTKGTFTNNIITVTGLDFSATSLPIQFNIRIQSDADADTSNSSVITIITSDKINFSIEFRQGASLIETISMPNFKVAGNTVVYRREGPSISIDYLDTGDAVQTITANSIDYTSYNNYNQDNDYSLWVYKTEVPISVSSITYQVTNPEFIRMENGTMTTTKNLLTRLPRDKEYITREYVENTTLLNPATISLDMNGNDITSATNITNTGLLSTANLDVSGTTNLAALTANLPLQLDASKNIIAANLEFSDINGLQTEVNKIATNEGDITALETKTANITDGVTINQSLATGSNVTFNNVKVNGQIDFDTVVPPSSIGYNDGLNRMFIDADSLNFTGRTEIGVDLGAVGTTGYLLPNSRTGALDGDAWVYNDATNAVEFTTLQISNINLLQTTLDTKLNSTATTNLNMNGNNITSATNITNTGLLSTANLDVSGTTNLAALTANLPLQLDASKNIIAANLAISDTTGLQAELNTKLNSTAATNLDMNGNDIIGATNITNTGLLSTANLDVSGITNLSALTANLPLQLDASKNVIAANLAISDTTGLQTEVNKIATNEGDITALETKTANITDGVTINQSLATTSNVTFDVINVTNVIEFDLESPVSRIGYDDGINRMFIDADSLNLHIASEIGVDLANVGTVGYYLPVSRTGALDGDAWVYNDAEKAVKFTTLQISNINSLQAELDTKLNSTATTNLNMNSNSITGATTITASGDVIGANITSTNLTDITTLQTKLTNVVYDVSLGKTLMKDVIIDDDGTADPSCVVYSDPGNIDPLQGTLVGDFINYDSANGYISLIDDSSSQAGNYIWYPFVATKRFKINVDWFSSNGNGNSNFASGFFRVEFGGTTNSNSTVNGDGYTVRFERVGTGASVEIRWFYNNVDITGITPPIFSITGNQFNLVEVLYDNQEITVSFNNSVLYNQTDVVDRNIEDVANSVIRIGGNSNDAFNTIARMRNILILKPEESIMYFRNNAQTSHAMVGMNKNSEFVINSNDATNQVNDIVFSVGGVGTIDNLTTAPTEVMRINESGVVLSGDINATGNITSTGLVSTANLNVSGTTNLAALIIDDDGTADPSCVVYSDPGNIDPLQGTLVGDFINYDSANGYIELVVGNNNNGQYIWYPFLASKRFLIKAEWKAKNEVNNPNFGGGKFRIEFGGTTNDNSTSPGNGYCVEFTRDDTTSDVNLKWFWNNVDITETPPATFFNEPYAYNGIEVLYDNQEITVKWNNTIVYNGIDAVDRNIEEVDNSVVRIGGHGAVGYAVEYRMRNILILKPEESIMYFRNNAQTSHAMVGMNKNSEFVINSNDATNQVNDIVFSVGGVGTIDNLTTEPTEIMRINEAGVEVSGGIINLSALTASLPLQLDASKNIIAANLAIADTTGLQSELDDKLDAVDTRITSVINYPINVDNLAIFTANNYELRYRTASKSLEFRYKTTLPSDGKVITWVSKRASGATNDNERTISTGLTLNTNYAVGTPTTFDLVSDGDTLDIMAGENNGAYYHVYVTLFDAIGGVPALLVVKSDYLFVSPNNQLAVMVEPEEALDSPIDSGWSLF